MDIWKHIWGPTKSVEEVKAFKPHKLESPKIKKLEEKFQSLSLRHGLACNTMRIKSSKYGEARNVRKRISGIRIRNKKRKILVVDVEVNESLLGESLISANDMADAVYSDNLEEAYVEFATSRFDMVYLIIQLGLESNCSGPCFFSMSEESDQKYRDSRRSLVENIREIENKFSGAEVIVVCGTSLLRCPLADRLYHDPGKSGIFKV